VPSRKQNQMVSCCAVLNDGMGHDSCWMFPARWRNTLLLTSRERTGSVTHPIAQPDSGEEVVGPTATLLVRDLHDR
jgi:hypothetical protein